MKKILLVEDDNNLREIYGARLLAEGYDIVSAKDGEEALSMAVAEKPDLIISDIMMPKISGFDMLDILRATPQTKDTKVIMMTALSQAEDRERGERLGADKYLVKSQVTLEDVVKVVEEVLGAADDSPAETAPAAEAAPAAAPAPVADPAPAPAPADPAAAPAPVADPAPAPQPAAPALDPPAAPSTGASSDKAGSNASLESASRKPKVIAPIVGTGPKEKDLNTLLAQEMAKEQGAVVAPTGPPPAPSDTETKADEQAVQSLVGGAETSAAEQKVVTEQIQDFVNNAPADPAAPQVATPDPAPSDTPPAAPAA